MKEHEFILNMIENVNPDDTEKLDEIDARVLCYVNNSNPNGEAWLGDEKTTVWRANLFIGKCNIYTRSRDALKSIRPDGLAVAIWSNGRCTKWVCGASKDADNPMTSVSLPTEELAELHAIIQAIAYERGLND